MSRALVILDTKAKRETAAGWCRNAPYGTRVEFREAKRSGAQNDRMWAMLTEIARQRPNHHGVKMTADLWKIVFMQALGMELRMMPTLDGDGFFPMGHRSSELSKAEMTDLQNLMEAWAAREGVELREGEEA